MGYGASMSAKSQRSQTSSQVVSVRARYSASVLERETTSCFLLCHETRKVPNRKQKPVIEHRSVGSPDQSVHLPSQHLNRHEARGKIERSNADHILDILAQCNRPKPNPACTSSLGFICLIYISNIIYSMFTYSFIFT